eukprot:COSAG01_NODE_1035_length_11997_cov_95.509665_7_plen_75_part_00
MVDDGAATFITLESCEVSSEVLVTCARLLVTGPWLVACMSARDSKAHGGAWGGEFRGSTGVIALVRRRLSEDAC